MNEPVKKDNYSLANKQALISEDPWQSLRSFTSARIALGKTGVAIPLKEVLALKLAHAHARDTVFSELDTAQLLAGLQPLQLPVCLVSSLAADRTIYLQRPDYGRKLNDVSVDKLNEVAGAGVDIAIVLTDGLSASAVNRHAIPLLQQFMTLAKDSGYAHAPVTLVRQGRVAIADEIGHLFKAKISMILVGERPGLTTAESLGVYITYQPQPGLTDEARNCISNIHPGGLPYSIAAAKMLYLVKTAMELQLSGVHLKENNFPLL